MIKRRNIWIFAVLFLCTWILFTLYPQPYNLAKSIYRVFNHPISYDLREEGIIKESVFSMAPQEIERFVLQEVVLYAYDWSVYEMPWYFPTAKEAIDKGKGDCKSRFIVIASVFESLDIPYSLHFSPTHIWINYEGKQETAQENIRVALLTTSEKERSFKAPEVDMEKVRESFKKGFWESMPKNRKALLFTGLLPFAFFITMPIILEKKSSRLPG